MAFFSSKKDIVSKKNPSHRQVFHSPILTSLFYLKSLLMDQKDPIWTCVSRLKECAFVLSSSALDYGKRPFTINSFCAVQYRLSRKKKKRKKFCKPSMQLTEESVALPKFPFVFFRLWDLTYMPLYRTYRYFPYIHSLVGNTIIFCTK